MDQHPREIFDRWSAMKFIAKCEGKKWNPSPDNRWIIGAHEGLKTRVKLCQDEKLLATEEVEIAKLDGKIEAFKWLLGEEVT